MNKTTHVEILGVQIPLRTLASVTSTPYVLWHGLTPSMFRSLCYDLPECVFDLRPPFETIAARTTSLRLPVHEGINRQFFTYSTLTKPTPDLKPWE